VVRGGVLVGVITRASYPRAKIACGWYTQYAPVWASGPAVAPTPSLYGAADLAPATEPVRAPRGARIARAAPPIEFARFDPAIADSQPFAPFAEETAPAGRKVRHRKKYRLSGRR
jgi:hypothetical protein